MNLNINPLNFSANLQNVGGKSTSAKTAKNFDNVIEKLQKAKELAVKSQQYLECYETKCKITDLPATDTIEFRNLRIVDEEVDVRDLSYRTPCLIYKTTPQNAEGLAEFENDIDFDYFEFKLDEQGNLNADEADDWFEKKLSYYA